MKIGLVGALVLGLVVASLGAKAAESNSAASNLAKDLFQSVSWNYNGRIAVWPLDSKEAALSALPASTAALLGEEVRTALQRVGLQKGYRFVERAAITKVFQEQQFSQGRTDAEFAELARQSGADALVIVSLNRRDSTNAVMSARLVQITGRTPGQLLAATGSYNFYVGLTSTALIAEWEAQACLEQPGSGWCRHEASP